VLAIENAGRQDRRVRAGVLGELAALARNHDVTGPVLVLIGTAVAAADIAAAEAFGADARRVA
jgi:uroporphyrin-III C-methyltransferase/precorrin-2 dehydrogenase/sirohydrochlorin ferrochelatase